MMQLMPLLSLRVYCNCLVSVSMTVRGRTERARNVTSAGHSIRV